MKPKKTSPSKPKLSFTVDRSEFDINSDWVEAVMGPSSPPSRKAPFFSPNDNNATGAKSATAAKEDTVVEKTPEEKNLPPASQTAPRESTTAAVSAAPGPWKLRPLRRITDGLTPGQYAVYSLMQTNCEPAPDGEETVYRGGYADLGRLTGLSKRGIQNVIGELQQKAVIQLHTPPGHHRTQTSAYLVPKPEVVLQAWYGRGWRFAFGKSKHLTDGATVALSATPKSF